jgi:predicted DNA-binding protein (MmcQ/YjbR family)
MNLEQLENILSSKSGVTKEFPFGDEAMVFKVMNKMFALIAWKEKPLRITLKSLPQDAIAYREIYSCVIEGYYMNKKHWNTIIIDGTMKEEILTEMIDESYNLVVDKLTKKEKLSLKNN